MPRWKVILGFVALLLLLGIVGRMDVEDEIRSAVFYCDMVEGGHWPDYDRIAHRCSEVRQAYANL